MPPQTPYHRFVFWLVVFGLVHAAPFALAAPDLQFVDVSGGRGIGPYTAPSGDYAGVVAADFDGDGDTDIFVPTAAGTPDQLYENDGAGNFTDIAAAAGVASTDRHRAALFFDHDGDDLLDLAVAGDCFDPQTGTCPSPPTLILYRQTAPGVFQDVSVSAGLSVALTDSPYVEVAGLVAGDINNDGYLDLYVSMWGPETWLFRNEGDGTFSDISELSGVVGDPAKARAQQPMMHDWNGDGWTDIYEAIDLPENRFFVNQGDETFVDQAAAAGLDSDDNDMGMTLGDVDNDGDLDIFVGAIFATGTNRQNALYRNDTVGGALSFAETATAAGVDDTDWAWGTTFFDADNDGWLDLAVTNGWGPFVDASRFFTNDGFGPISFTDDSLAVGFDDDDKATGLVAADFDRDGDVDLLQSVMDGGPLRLLDNQFTGGGSPGNYVVVRPRRVLGGNRRGIGAVVRVTAGGTSQMRLITAGTSFLGQEPAEAFFGLGTAGTVDSIDVEWLDGSTTSMTSVAVNQTVSLSPIVEVAIGPPTLAETQTDPVSWTVSYSGADAVTLTETDLTLVTTGTATGTLAVSGSGTSQRTVTVSSISGAGRIGFSIAGGTASDSGSGALAAAVGPGVRTNVGTDLDGDGVPAGLDNCETVANPLQEDTDGDGEGDACNEANDADGDEYADALDNCPNDPNPNQWDFDFDEIGDACDLQIEPLTVARKWNETLLSAIRRDYPAPTVHSRNLFHLSAAMWDAWAAYDLVPRGYFVTEKLSAQDVQAARSEAISFAAYGILKSRFVEPKSSPDAAAFASAAFDDLMLHLGYDPSYTETAGGANPAAELGNRIAAAVIAFGSTDGAN